MEFKAYQYFALAFNIVIQSNGIFLVIMLTDGCS